MSAEYKCWICGKADFDMIRKSTIRTEVTAEDFSITDSNYGCTASIYRCNSCGFRQCLDIGEVIGFYESLQDNEYEVGRLERGIQATRLLKRIRDFGGGENLLDVGAGTGILVEQALNLGFKAEGLEPSVWSCQRAQKLDLPVKQGALPEAGSKQPLRDREFDVITAIDVLEHVDDPVSLLASMRSLMKSNGICVIVTPDVRSLMARALGYKWWHYRIAHIGYFGKNDIVKAFNQAGLEPIKWHRPWWYFSAAYLLVRVMLYLPEWMRFEPPPWTQKIPIPLNLFDSWFVVARKSDRC